MKVLRCIIVGFFFLSMVSAVVALCGFEQLAEILCLCGVIPVIGFLLLGIECQRHQWDTTASVGAAKVAPAGTEPAPRSGP